MTQVYIFAVQESVKIRDNAPLNIIAILKATKHLFQHSTSITRNGSLNNGRCNVKTNLRRRI